MNTTCLRRRDVVDINSSFRFFNRTQGFAQLIFDIDPGHRQKAKSDGRRTSASGPERSSARPFLEVEAVLLMSLDGLLELRTSNSTIKGCTTHRFEILENRGASNINV